MMREVRRTKDKFFFREALKEFLESKSGDRFYELKELLSLEFFCGASTCALYTLITVNFMIKRITSFMEGTCCFISIKKEPFV